MGISEQLAGIFDFEVGEGGFEVPYFQRLNGFGIIVGPSGSGKTSVLKSLGNIEIPTWSSEPICEHFASTEDALERFSAVGLHSVPTWFRSFDQLSNGEQFRANLARVLNDGALIDEFTSVVDRSVAKSVSVAISRYIKKHKLNVVLASCHYDILEWLEPDWVFDLVSKEVRRDFLEGQPSLSKWWKYLVKHGGRSGSITISQGHSSVVLDASSRSGTESQLDSPQQLVFHLEP